MTRLLLAIICVALHTFANAQEVEVHPPPKAFVHAVYFWLNDEVTESQKAQFADGMWELRKISSVRSMHVGIAANVPRPVVDNSYDFALIVYFDDRAGHDLYQEDPIHTDLLKNTKNLIREIRIYDSVSR